MKLPPSGGKFRVSIRNFMQTIRPLADISHTMHQFCRRHLATSGRGVGVARVAHTGKNPHRFSASYRLLTGIFIAVSLLAMWLPAVSAEKRLLPEPIGELDTGNRAVDALIQRARQLVANGAPEMAATELERAIRIAPRSALVWHELARVRFTQGRTKDAETLASKADVLAVKDLVKSANGRLLNMSRSANGKPTIAIGNVASTTAPNPQEANAPAVTETAPTATAPPSATAINQSYSDAAPNSSTNVDMQSWHSKPVIGAVNTTTSNRSSPGSGQSPQTIAGRSLPIVIERSAPVRHHGQRVPISRPPRQKDDSRLQQGRRGAPIVEKSIVANHRIARAQPVVPPDLIPPPGTCRLWFNDRAPADQPPPGDCGFLRDRLPTDAQLISGPAAVGNSAH